MRRHSFEAMMSDHVCWRLQNQNRKFPYQLILLPLRFTSLKIKNSLATYFLPSIGQRSMYLGAILSTLPTFTQTPAKCDTTMCTQGSMQAYKKSCNNGWARPTHIWQQKHIWNHYIGTPTCKPGWPIYTLFIHFVRHLNNELHFRNWLLSSLFFLILFVSFFLIIRYHHTKC